MYDSGGRMNIYIPISYLKQFKKVVTNIRVTGFANSYAANDWSVQIMTAGEDITSKIANTTYKYLWSRQMHESGYNTTANFDLTIS